MSNNVKFLWNGVKIDGTLYKGSYSAGPYTPGSLPEGTVTIYMGGSNTPRIDGFVVENDSDIMTDYFDNDTVRILPNSKYHEAALVAVRDSEIHYTKLAIKQIEKRLARYAGTGTHMEAFYRQELSTKRSRLSELTADAPKKHRPEPCR